MVDLQILANVDGCSPYAERQVEEVGFACLALPQRARLRRLWIVLEELELCSGDWSVHEVASVFRSSQV